MGGHWFFTLGGVILMLTGVLQAVVRPRRPGEHRLLNRGTLFGAFCVLVGLAAVLLASGVLPVRLR